MRFLNRHPQYIIRWHVCSAHITPPESTQSTTFITSTHKKKKYETERDKKEAFISSKAFRFCRFYFTYLKIHSYYLCVYMNVVIFCHRHLLFHSSYFFFCFIDRFSNDLRIFIYCKYLKYTHTFEVRVKEKDRHKVTKISYFVLLLLLLLFWV